MTVSGNGFTAIATLLLAILSGCNQGSGNLPPLEMEILEDEKWWGGAIMDGINMPFSQDQFIYDQEANCKANQAQPLFISNKGRYIWSDEPLKIEIAGDLILVESKSGEVVTRQEGASLKEVFLFARGKFFPSFAKTPDPLLFTKPQYNTWIELQYDQNQQDILKYAEDIFKNGFPAGVIMIDDNWQKRYGTWEFDCEKFQDPKSMIEKLHDMGSKVILWVVPFISADSPVYRKLAARRMPIFEDSEETRPASIKWWNGMSGLFDLSNPESEKWFKDQLSTLVSKYGVDGFKLYAGDPESYVGTYSLNDFSPNGHCESYARIGLDYSLNEYRACWKMAGQPLAQRLRDKTHSVRI